MECGAANFFTNHVIRSRLSLTFKTSRQLHTYMYAFLDILLYERTVQATAVSETPERYGNSMICLAQQKTFQKMLYVTCRITIIAVDDGR